MTRDHVFTPHSRLILPPINPLKDVTDQSPSKPTADPTRSDVAPAEKLPNIKVGNGVAGQKSQFVNGNSETTTATRKRKFIDATTNRDPSYLEANAIVRAHLRKSSIATDPNSQRDLGSAVYKNIWGNGRQGSRTDNFITRNLEARIRSHESNTNDSYSSSRSSATIAPFLNMRQRKQRVALPSLTLDSQNPQGHSRHKVAGDFLKRT